MLCPTSLPRILRGKYRWARRLHRPPPSLTSPEDEINTLPQPWALGPALGPGSPEGQE